MARPTKQGLSYFPLDVDFLQDIKIRKIMRACGNTSISILISLLCNIYKDNGYYILWDNDLPFLIADEVGVTEGAVVEVLKKALQVKLFSEEKYKKFSILTSRGIQERFIKATDRRVKIQLKPDYCIQDVDNNPDNDDSNSINDDRSTQSKVKESKGKESIPEELIPELIPEEYNSFFEEVWNLYPKKKGKSVITPKIKKDLFKIGNDLKTAVENYKEEIRINQTEEQFIKYGSTFFKGGYIDYLPGNYKRPKPGKTNFNNYDQRQNNYDNVIMGWADDSDS